MDLCWQIKVDIFTKFFLNKIENTSHLLKEYEVVDDCLHRVPCIGFTSENFHGRVLVPRKWLDRYLNQNPNMKEFQVLHQLRRQENAK